MPLPVVFSHVLRWGAGVYDMKADAGTNYDISKGAMGTMGAMGTDSYGTFGGKVEAGADYSSKGAQAAGYGNLGYGSNEYGVCNVCDVMSDLSWVASVIFL